MQIIDSHCHLDRLKLDALEEASLEQVLLEASQAAVSHMLCVGIDYSNAQAVKDIAARFDNVFASVGVHPCDVKDVCPSEETLRQLADDANVIALGETGLDYYYSAEQKQVQQESFAMQLSLAKTLALPVIVHTRDAKADTLALIKEHACEKSAGVLHCFTEDWDMAKAALDMGYYISFSGIVTFKNALELKEVAKKVPADRFLVETDSPYLAPVPFRGKPNYPKHTRQVAEYIAQLRGEPLERIAEQSSENFVRLFPKSNIVLAHTSD